MAVNVIELAEELSVEQAIELYARTRLLEAQHKLRAKGQPVTSETLADCACESHSNFTIGGEYDEYVTSIIDRCVEEYVRD
jgi:hypothetical protein